MLDVMSFAAGQWVAPDDSARLIESAVTGEPVARAGGPLDTEAMLRHAAVGGAALREMGFHDRARMLKALALYLKERAEELHQLSYMTGATRKDGQIDIEGGITTMLVIASKGRREMPDAKVMLDGAPEMLSRQGTFRGQHIWVPRTGVAVHINAFNFPVWGMLEKLAPTLLAGMPAIVKPATATSYVTHAAMRMMVDSGVLPEGAVQMIAGGTGDLLDRLGAQDVVSFTGSAETALKLQGPLVRRGVRFIAEQDSLNASLLGPDAGPGSPEWDIFVREVRREITAKAGQKCTAIRRIMVLEARVADVIGALESALQVRIGAPDLEATQMGALVSRVQRTDVLEKAAAIGQHAGRVLGDPEQFEVEGADARRGAFLPPMLYHAVDPDASTVIHETEAFGPVSTVMGYRDLGHAVELMNRGGGALVASLITHDPEVAMEVALGIAPWHGRIYVNDRCSAKEATGHGSPLPHMVHGGPGRAGGGEELGGIRGALHYMQRVGVQGSPDMLSAIAGTWMEGAAESPAPDHPFQRRFGALEVGETLYTPSREVTLEDIEHFAKFTGDTFYAHMDEEAAAANPFFPGRVAHGYLLLSFAAGLFVQPDPGPVLANTGLDGLRFLKPVSPGDRISVRLTVLKKTRRTEEYGEVRWSVGLSNQDGEPVAEYELLTMVAY